MKNRMLKLTLSILMFVAMISVIIFFGGCSDDPSSTTKTVTSTTTTPETTETTLTEFYTYDSTSVRKYDGTDHTVILTGQCSCANNNKIACDDLLYTLDDYGNTLSTTQLITTPDYILIDGTDVWIIENVEPADAYDAGGLYKDYTKVYKNNVEVDHWYNRQWKTTDFYQTESGHMISENSTGSHHLINNDTLGDVHYSAKDGMLFYNFDSTNKTANIYTDGIYSISWTLNYFNSTDQWIKSGGVWYSYNGYEWSETNGLTENDNAMSSWRNDDDYIIDDIPSGEYVVVIAAGVRTENSEEILYWIECNTGSLIRYAGSIDSLTKVTNLYDGDGYRDTGLLYETVLNPYISGDYLYFENNGYLYRYSFVDKNILLFYGGAAQIWHE